MGAKVLKKGKGGKEAGERRKEKGEKSKVK
jgi:hypothetical protein